MKHAILGMVAASALLASSAAYAQTSTQITISQPERTKIKEYVVKEKVKPVTIKEKVTVGATLPAEVEIRSAPADWGASASKYSYVYTDNHVVLVEPSSRKIVQIIE